MFFFSAHFFFFTLEASSKAIASPSIREMAFTLNDDRATSVRDGRSAPMESNLVRTSDKVRKRPREEKKIIQITVCLSSAKFCENISFRSLASIQLAKTSRTTITLCSSTLGLCFSLRLRGIVLGVGEDREGENKNVTF